MTAPLGSVTHPPLSRADLDRIAAKHASPDAVLLLREIERLRAVESYARQLIEMAQEMPGDTPKLLASGLAAALEGRLPGGGRFRAAPPNLNGG